MGGTGGHSEPIVARFLIALLAVTCALLAATAPVLAGTPVDSKLDLPFPPDGQYMFRSFDESGGRVVFALPASSSSPFQIFTWTEAEGLTALTTGGQDDPAVDGDVVVWVDGGRIKGVDLSTDKRFDLGDGFDQSQPDVSGDWIVWNEGLAGIRAANFKTGETASSPRRPRSSAPASATTSWCGWTTGRGSAMTSTGTG